MAIIPSKTLAPCQGTASGAGPVQVPSPASRDPGASACPARHDGSRRWAVHEGKVAAEVAAGQNRHFDARVIPSVAYTDPEVAWVGVTETSAKAEGRKIGKGVFPWAASGRSLSLGRSEGITKVVFDEADDRVIGAAIVGPNAGDLIAEVALAIEMGADAVDLGHTIHPHPTLSETVNFAAEMFEGTITDLIPPKKRH